MDHVDLASAREMGSSPAFTTLHVSVPYSSNNSTYNSNSNIYNNNNNNSSHINNNSNASGSTSGVAAYGGSTSPRTPHVHSLAGSMAASSVMNNPTSNTSRSLAKPTLDTSHIRLCSEECWMPDAQVMTCMAHECNVSFSLFNRRHHCRVCGRIFCAACCSHFITLRGDNHTGTTGSLVTSFLDGVESPTASSTTPHRIGDKVHGQRNSILSSTRPLQSSPSQSLQQIGSSYHQRQPSQQQQQLQPSGSSSFSTTHRICSACYYELQLVVSRRDHTGEARRKCRGELKMLQWSLLVNMLTYLSMHDLLEVSLVSSDFYFMSRDNVIWYQYNLAQYQQKEKELKIPTASNYFNPSLRHRLLNRHKVRAFRTDFEDITPTDASKRVISLHARYNFTQFLDFARQQEMARCKGFLSFSVGARMLLSSPLKIAIIGPTGIGKSSMVRCFAGPHAAHTSWREPLPTMGFTRYEKTVHLTGSLMADVMLHVFDISGEPRFEELRRFICSNCHAVGICYDARRKVTLVQAADIMMGVEPALGPQPVVVCGIMGPTNTTNNTDEIPTTTTNTNTNSNSNSNTNSTATTMATPIAVSEPAVQEIHAMGITVRGRASLQCQWNNSEPLFQSLLQSLLDRLAMATATSSVVAAAASNGRAKIDEKESATNLAVAQELLRITLNPSALDILLEQK
ncbi:putative small GTP-binding protein Rab7 [Trypanosoma theileri]|uniref:Putative small GTP-binding protein Rab7 n=1 Tax=Trypanosoma theileri TaxID=67003 RepID=A0A1X0NPZ6_9TRYP|nr:putative small GTP-binding protein Rab7 [Trypanosoma theileri]ORC86259.1 putative small GTP-binding protein Rab7 [Trypanosoma theileri]